MATKTITRTLTETTTQPDITQQFPQSSEESTGGTGGFGGPIPLRPARLDPTEAQVHTTLVNAFRRSLRCPRGEGPPDDDDLGDEGDDPPNNEPNEAGLQDHVPIPLAQDIKPMGSLPRIFNRDRSRADAFLTEYLRYLMLNQGVPGFESPI